MKIEARHLKRKQLNQYLDSEFMKHERKLSESVISKNATSILNRRRRSNETSEQTLKKNKGNDLVSFTNVKFA